MKIGLIDVDGHNFPNLPLMKISAFEQDLERVHLLRDMGYSPYIMIYNKDKTKPKDNVRRLQRYVNNRFIFRSCKKFEDYKG